MGKSIHTPEYALLLGLIREAREAAGLTQVELARILGQSQSFVSKMEVGERRIDVIQLRTVCLALGVSLTDFIQRFEERISKPASKTSP